MNPTYARCHAHPGAEEGDDAAADPGVAGARAAPRLRHLQADRSAIARSGADARGVAVSAAVPAGAAAVDRRSVGGESGGATTSLLPDHGGGAAATAGAAAEL